MRKTYRKTQIITAAMLTAALALTGCAGKQPDSGSIQENGTQLQSQNQTQSHEDVSYQAQSESTQDSQMQQNPAADTEADNPGTDSAKQAQADSKTAPESEPVGQTPISKPSDTVSQPTQAATAQITTPVPSPTTAPTAATTQSPATSTENIVSQANALSAANIAYYNEILDLVNSIRAEAGVSPLTLDTTLCQAATVRAIEMDNTGVFSHTRPDGTDCWSVFKLYGITYRTCGENIAMGQRTPAQVVESWRNSPGHYANMVKAGFGKLGVGMSNSNRIYWVQMFTN